MSRGAPFCVAAQTWQDGLTRYPPSASQQWNATPLQPSDYDEEFYLTIVDLERRHQMHEFSEADFDQLGLTFSLITAQGKLYNLIPNGSEIRVTKTNAHEYFQRVHSAYGSLRQHNALLTSPPPTAPAITSSSPSRQQQRLRSIATERRLTSQDIPAIEWLRWSARNDPEQLILPPGDKLRWAVVPRPKDFMIRLCPEGELRIVEPDDLGLFLDELVATINEIERAIVNFGYYPPNVISAVPATLTEENITVIQQNIPSTQTAMMPMPPQRVSSNGRIAVYASARAAAATTGQDRRYVPSASPAELEKQRALFSPTHNIGNILAPFQEINV